MAGRFTGWTAVLFAVVALWTGPAQAEGDGAERFLLVVANNHSLDADVPSLRFADDDGARYYELLAPGASRAVLLTTFDDESQALYPELVQVARPPTRVNLTSALEELRGRIAAARKKGRTTTLHVVFTGHGEIAQGGGAAHFSLLDTVWTRDDMVDRVIAPQWADFTHLVVDACNAYFLVQGRGGWENDEVEDPEYDRAVQRYLTTSDVLHRYPRTGILLSTAGAQEVHEWGAYRSGVFSHQLRSALVGAADVDGDGELRYDEIEAYVAAANAAVSNPKARISVTAQAPRQNRRVPFLRLGSLRPAARLLIPEGKRGRFVIEDERGLRYADVTTGGDRPLSLALMGAGRAGARFHVRYGEQEAAVELSGPRNVEVQYASLTWSPAQAQARSSVGEEFRANLFAVPFSADFHRGYTASLRPPGTLVVGAAPDEDPSRWGVELSAGAGQSIVGDGLGTSASLGLRYGGRQGWFGRLQLDAGFSDATLSATAGSDGLRHFAWGAGAGYAVELGAGWIFGPELMVQHLLAAESGAEGQTRADRTGLRGALGLFAGVHLGDWYLGASAGPAVNVLSVLERDGDFTYLDDTSFLQIEGRLLLRRDF
jgi:hypothetical protein